MTFRNSSEDNCIVDEHIGSFEPSSELTKSIGVVLLVLGIPTVVVFSWWYIRRRQTSQYLQKRMLPFVLIPAVGALLELIGWCVRELVGRDKFPCAIQNNLIVITVFFIGPCIGIRSLLNYNRIKLQRKWAASRYYEVVQSFDFFMEQIPDAYIPKRANSVIQPTTYLNDSATNSSFPSTSVSGASDSSIGIQQLHRAMYLASSRFGYHVLALCCILGFAMAIYEVSSVVNCFGCLVTESDLLLSTGIALIVLIPNYWALYKTWNEPDPLNIQSELGVNLLGPAGVYVAWILLYAFDPSSIHQEGHFCWHYLHVLSVLWYFINSVPLQIWYSYSFDRPSRSSNTEMDVKQILSSDSGRNYFKAHLTLELSIENYLFWEAATKWKKSYRASNDKAVNDVKYIFNCFIAEGAPLQVNASWDAQENVKKLLSASVANETVIPLHILDEYIDVSFSFMMQSLYRFRRSRLYLEFVGEIDNENIV